MMTVLLHAPAAEGYVRSRTSTGQPLTWNRTCLAISLYAGDPPRFLDRETLEAAARAATTTWSADAVSCTSLRLLLSTSPQPRADAAYDRRNNVTFRRVAWRKEPCDDASGTCTAYDPMAIAVTTIFAVPETGEILDADIEINAVGTVWADVARDGGSGADVQNVLTHELGHLIGLDHNALPDSVMFATGVPGEIDKRQLADDDRAAVCEIYPLETDLPCTPPAPAPVPAGGCTVAAPTRPGFTILLLAALARSRSKARRRSGPASQAE